MDKPMKSNRRLKITNPSKNTEIPKVIIVDKKEEPNFYKCCSCGTAYKKLDNNFPASQSELYAGLDYHLPICRKCLDILFEHYTVSYGGDEDKAIRRICEMFDIYFNESLLNASRKITKDRSRIHTYISRANLLQYKGKTYDSTLDEERGNIIESLEHLQQLKEEGIISTSTASAERWGVGLFSDEEYKILDEHYKMLKKANPNCDSNQEIFIKDLCYTKLQQMKALKANNLDAFKKATELYRDTFKQAGLKTVQEIDNSNDETLGVTLAVISQYTPEEYYKDKNLYKDFEGLGSYITRFILRPLKNLMFGSTERDEEYCVKDGEDDE